MESNQTIPNSSRNFGPGSNTNDAISSELQSLLPLQGDQNRDPEATDAPGLLPFPLSPALLDQLGDIAVGILESAKLVEEAKLHDTVRKDRAKLKALSEAKQKLHDIFIKIQDTVTLIGEVAISGK